MARPGETVQIRPGIMERDRSHVEPAPRASYQGEPSVVIRRTFTVGVDDLTAAIGALVCRDLPLATGAGPASIRRGAIVDDTLCSTLAKHSGARLEVVVSEPGELEQGEASLQFARSIVGDGLTVDPPHQGQCVVRAMTTGVLRVCSNRVARVNRHCAILLVTALDGRVVDEADTVAIVKAAQLWTPLAELERARRLAGPRPFLRVAPFTARFAGFLAGPRIRPTNFAMAAENLRGLLGSFGVDLVTAQRVSDDIPSIVTAYRQCLDLGAEIILIGGSIVLDPSDPFVVALEEIHATLECRGAPIDPGTMFWVAYAGPTVLFGLASCELYGRRSILDLVLPYAVAKEPITHALLADLGYGGLLDQTFAARRKPGQGS